MKLPEDHPDTTEDSGYEDAAGGGGADLGARGGGIAEDGGDDYRDDYIEPSAPADVPPPELYYDTNHTGRRVLRSRRPEPI
jgi:hypothetical protein